MYKRLVELALTTAALGLSALALGASTWSYYYAYRKTAEISDSISRIEEDLNEIKYIEQEVFGKNESEEDFKKSISDISERLFNLIKNKYNLEDVTTYQEMMDELEELEVDDQETKNDLQTLFENFVRLEYSDRELSEDEKAIIRQAAFSLIRTAGSDLLDLREDRVKG